MQIQNYNRVLIIIISYLIHISNVLAHSEDSRFLHDSIFEYNQDDHSITAGQFITHLIDNHRHELPMRPTRSKIPVGVYVKIESISSISEVNMDMTVTMILRQTWVDKRLDLSFMEEGETKMIVIPPEIAQKIWKPDIFIEGSKESKVHSTIVENVVMRVRNKGQIEYTVKLSSTMLCEMTLYYFPLDRETCSIVFQSCK